MAFIAFLIFVFLAAAAALLGKFATTDKSERKVCFMSAAALSAIAAICFLFSMFVTVSASKIGVVTTFGKVQNATLTEGAHFVAPWAKVNPVYIGMDVAAATKAQAASKDLQSVHSDLTVNFHVEHASAIPIFRAIPSLAYKEAFVIPAMHEVFKAVVARYTAEELVTDRQKVSAAISAALNERLKQYYLTTQSVNLVNFGFSKAFDNAIEEKVTASQKAETAKRNLERVKFEADARIAQAEGEAKAISIQAAATEKSGGAAYIQLQAIGKWDGKLPQYMTSGSATPFISVK